MSGGIWEQAALLELTPFREEGKSADADAQLERRAMKLALLGGL